MGQTIICEFLAEWEESNQQPDPRNHGFDGLHSMLEECQNVMFALGESANAKAARIAELESALDKNVHFAHALLEKRGRQVEELTQDVERLNRENDELQATNERLLRLVGATVVTIEAAAGKEYVEGCKP